MYNNVKYRQAHPTRTEISIISYLRSEEVCEWKFNQKSKKYI